jgi:hypothetical protein
LGEEPGGRVLGVQAGFDGVAAWLGLQGLRWERLAAGHHELEADQVEAGDGFGDRVLDLDAGVDLQEPEAVVGEEELDRAGADVADGVGHGQGGVAEAAAEVGVDGDRGRLLDQLLVAALDRALTLEQVDHVAVLVGEELDLDVAGGIQPAFEEDGGVAEGGRRLAAGRVDGGGQAGRVVDDPHADAAAAVGRLDQQRVADLLPRGGQQIAGTRNRRAWEHRNSRLRRDPAGFELVAEGGQDLRRGADPAEPGGQDRLGELRLLGQESVAGVDGVGAGAAGGVEDGVGAQVGVGRGGAAEGDGLAGLGDEGGVAVGVGEHGHGGDAHGPGRAQDSGGDLAPVGDQELGDHIRNTP